VRSYLKNNLKQKRAGGVVQVVEGLLSKHKTLSSIPSTERERENDAKVPFLNSMIPKTHHLGICGLHQGFATKCSNVTSPPPPPLSEIPLAELGSGAPVPEQGL
jgi:hypothetical protein